MYSVYSIIYTYVMLSVVNKSWDLMSYCKVSISVYRLLLILVLEYYLTIFGYNTWYEPTESLLWMLTDYYMLTRFIALYWDQNIICKHHESFMNSIKMTWTIYTILTGTELNVILRFILQNVYRIIYAVYM